MLRYFAKGLGWLGHWAYWVALICFFGAVAGVATHTLYGLFFGAGWGLGYYAAFGFLNGLKYSSLWAGGAAIVACVMRARREVVGAELPQ